MKELFKWIVYSFFYALSLSPILGISIAKIQSSDVNVINKIWLGVSTVVVTIICMYNIRLWVERVMNDE